METTIMETLIGSGPPHEGTHDIEFWRHFSESGARDKNTMLTTVTSLLGFAAALVAYSFNSLVPFPGTQQAGKLMAASILGFLISAVATYVTLLYAGYSNRNWSRADEIAKRCQWAAPLPDDERHLRHPGSEADLMAGLAASLSRHHDPDTELAPIFKTFLCLTLLSSATHLVLVFTAGVRLIT